MKKVTKIFLEVVIIIVIILITMFSIKYITINKILNSQKSNMNIGNYHIEYSIALNDEDAKNMEIYKSNEKEYMKTDTYRILTNKTEKKTYFVNDINKTISIISMEDNTNISDGLNNIITENLTENFLTKAKYVFTWKVNTEMKDNVECYHIKLKNSDEIWLDKNVMLEKESIKHIDSNVNVQKIDKFEIDNVQESDFELKDIEGYTYINQ